MPYTQLAQPFVLTAASTSKLGGIKIDGDVVTLDNDVLSIDGTKLLKGTGTNSVAINGNAEEQNTVAISGSAKDLDGVAIGANSAAYDEACIAIGPGAKAYACYDSTTDEFQWAGIAIGDTANATNGGIQLGSGTNRDSDTFCVGGDSENFELLNLTSGKIPSARIPGATVTNAGKFLKIDAQGEVVAEALPLYNGGVS